MAEKIGILVAKNIECTLNHDVIDKITVNNQWLAFLPFLSHRREIYLTFQYGNGDERSTKLARIGGQDKAYYYESITLPVARVAEEFKITCYDGNNVGSILGFTKGTLGDSLNQKRPSNNNAGKVRKVQLGLTRDGEIVGEVAFSLMFLSMEVPRKKMRQIELNSLRGKIIGIMIIDNVKVKNFNGRNGYLRVMLGNEKASTKKYFKTNDKKCPYGIILPVVASPNFSMLLQIYYSRNEFGNRQILFTSQEEDLWLKLMNDGQVSVPEISFHTGGSLVATANFTISVHKSLNPLRLGSQDPTISPKPSESPSEMNNDDSFTNFSSSPSSRSEPISSLRVVCQKYMIVSPVPVGPHKTINNDANRKRVYLTIHTSTNFEFICKEHFVQSSFSNEIKHLGNLKSEYIVKWADLERYEDGGGIVVLENYGDSLDNVYPRFRESRDVLILFYNICEAVQFLYTHGVVHTNLCPSNILCNDTNMKLCGMEHVRFKDDVIYGSTSQQIQQQLTIGFTPPEFFNFNQEILYAEYNQDIFGLGAIFFLLYRKKLLYNDIEDLDSLCREFDNRINEEIPQYISNIIIKACKPNPQDRCKISELCKDVKMLLNQQYQQHSRGKRISDN
ncbi:hypothetical protein Glove_469g44 [Diversispora epigaea]|uniref:Protein kinase domain-containing protein n=1 Tax=Diversispora epigaea TaxID=1348612 RepID=A0A397GUT2_9GLOM|nr:hypothetical protein Glove_469g44 [Diversispora epigaea]